MRGLLPVPAVIIIAVLAGFGIRHCWRWVPSFVQRLCLCSVVDEIAAVHYISRPLNYCQWMEQPQLIEVSVVVVIVVHAVVLPAILQS